MTCILKYYQLIQFPEKEEFLQRFRSVLFIASDILYYLKINSSVGYVLINFIAVIYTMISFIIFVITFLIICSKLIYSLCLGQKVCRILTLLIVENHELLPGIAKLDPLPADSQFENVLQTYNRVRYGNNGEVSATLAHDIKHFLDAGKHHLNHRCRLEGLKYLKLQVSYIFSQKIYLFCKFCKFNCNNYY